MFSIKKSAFLSFVNFYSIVGCLVLIFAALILLTTYFTVRQQTEDRLLKDGELQLTQLENALQSMLNRHDYLPKLVAHDHQVQSLLLYSSKPKTLAYNELQLRVNQLLKSYNRVARTAEIYVIKNDGLTIAASNWDAPEDKSFLNKNYGFRPYFKIAKEGRLGRYYALGTSSNKRGYFFASPISHVDKGIIGVIAVKISVDDVEQVFRQSGVHFLVTDNDGVIFMSHDHDWVMHALQPLSASVRRKLHINKRYNQQAIKPLNVKREELLDSDNGLLRSYIQLDGKPYLELKKYMHAEGWWIHSILDRKPAQNSLLLAMFVSALLVLLLTLLAYTIGKYFLQRRRFVLETQQKLETEVHERTKELRAAQDELTQAAKMAALGQLSASINHELNNPLTAIRAYADNGLQFLAMQAYEPVANNLTEISALTERMGLITRQLKAFSRKSEGQIEACDMRQALNSSLLIVQARLSRHQVEVVQAFHQDEVKVLADLVWLEQIIINLLSNAIEAMHDCERKCITVSTQATNDGVVLTIQDSGKGIVVDALPHVFDAFFTTKSAGKGLGLGLSISYRLAKDMQGDLSVVNAEEGGAVFALVLPAVERST